MTMRIWLRFGGMFFFLENEYFEARSRETLQNLIFKFTFNWRSIRAFLIAIQNPLLMCISEDRRLAWKKSFTRISKANRNKGNFLFVDISQKYVFPEKNSLKFVSLFAVGSSRKIFKVAVLRSSERQESAST